jgi:hypothetical protein
MLLLWKKEPATALFQQPGEADVPEDDAQMKVVDKYDLAIDYLSRHEDEIIAAFLHPSTHSAGFLFAYLSPPLAESPETAELPDGKICGCPLLVHRNSAFYGAWSKEMTEALRSDSRLPNSIAEIRACHLPRFAAYQRWADRTFRRTHVTT